MIRIAICDDENFFAEELKELISGYMMNSVKKRKFDFIEGTKEAPLLSVIR